MALAKCRIVSRASSFFLIATAMSAMWWAAPAEAAPTQAQIATTEGQVVNLESTIASEQQQSAALDAQFLAAQTTVSQDQTALAATQTQLAKTRAHVRVDRARLAQDAIDAYIDDVPANQVDSLFVNSPTKSDARAQYQDAAVGNVTVAV